MALLQAERLIQRYGAMTAVGGVDLALEPGQVVGLLGPNGAGKTTTFRMLVGLERPLAGKIHFLGQEITRWPLYRRARAGIGFLPQQASIFPRISVLENLSLVLDKKAAQKKLEEAGLGALAGQLAGTLSGGERRRLEIVRCLALEPRVILLDEPFAGVDPAHIRALQETILGLVSPKTAILLTDHAVRETLGICQRVYVLDGGLVQAQGTPQEIAQNPLVKKRYLGEDFVWDKSLK